MQRISPQWNKAGERRSFFMVRSDTHGLAYTGFRPYPDTMQTEYVIQGGKTNMDQKAIALAAAKALDAKRGKDIVVLKVDESDIRGPLGVW